MDGFIDFRRLGQYLVVLFSAITEKGIDRGIRKELVEFSGKNKQMISSVSS